MASINFTIWSLLALVAVLLMGLVVAISLTFDAVVGAYDDNSKPSLQGDVGKPALGRSRCFAGQIEVFSSTGRVCRDESVRITPIGEITQLLEISMTTGADGLGLMAYREVIDDSHKLRTAHCEDSVCSTSTISTLDSSGVAGVFPSIAIGSDGLGLVGYWDGIEDDLKVAHCDDVACTGATISTVVADEHSGATSVAIGSDGLGLIVYLDNAPADVDERLQVGHCNDLNCTAFSTVTTLDSGIQFSSPVVTIGDDGLGLVSYFRGSELLEVRHCEDLECTSSTPSPVDAEVEEGSTAATMSGPDGFGIIAYYDRRNLLRVAHCEDSACTVSSADVIDSEGDGRDTSIALGGDGTGLIAYRVNNGPGLRQLKVAHCSNLTCSSATISTLNSGAGSGAAVTIGGDGLGLIAYTGGDGRLTVAHCKNHLCTP